MNVSKEQLHKLIDLIPDDKNDEVVLLLEKYVLKGESVIKKNPADYRGILKDWNIDVLEECRKMREEWDHRGWDALS